MSAFKVGQRVRIVCATSKRYGLEATILHAWEFPFSGRVSDERSGESWHVAVDGWGVRGEHGKLFRFFDDELAPLLPPEQKSDEKAQAFIQSLKRPCYVEPTVTKETVK